MGATQLGQKTFIHRLHPYGSVQSICPDCFATVGRSENEENLVRAEHSHACDRESLVKLACFWNPAQDCGSALPCIQLFRFVLSGSGRETGRVLGGSRIPSCRISSEMRL